MPLPCVSTAFVAKKMPLPCGHKVATEWGDDAASVIDHFGTQTIRKPKLIFHRQFQLDPSRLDLDHDLDLFLKSLIK